ncbi:YisL family protein [Bacillus sp. FJAT-49736]|uniref:YisL family protein n=1 Tax=Bacillus sp. FJAT-49736 TaxID=2833582 RepID=UPI001BCA4BAA|nr:YisL family protein [Bacillus sp. FJAT-49736]MBS4172016.1 YisL family protein [Bacillus sp. FJAT-49736]
MLHRTDAHITTWVIAIILFIVALLLHKAGKERGARIVQMIVRLFYILVIVTGALLFFNNQSVDPALYGVKLLVGLIVIVLMEMILVRTMKKKGTGILWLLFVILFLAALYLGLKLPLGPWHPFS